MSMQYIRDYYRVPAKRGARLAFQGRPGTIVGSSHQYLRVRLDGDTSTVLLHPTWEVEYAEGVA
jgi:hypothetical protein